MPIVGAVRASHARRMSAVHTVTHTRLTRLGAVLGGALAAIWFVATVTLSALILGAF